jgi:ectoine hydroxylase-related dioxygenase (phytanoyl-CoA dioxygenase family)
MLPITSCDGVSDGTIARDGFVVVQSVISKKWLNQLIVLLPNTRPNIRRGFDCPAIVDLARCEAIKDEVGSVLGPQCFAVRATLFNKTATSNWKVTWHQDAAIAVRSRCELEGWGPWSLKKGIPHVRPNHTVLENMLAVRIHLDDCGNENGPLRVLPGTHLNGILSDEEIVGLPKRDQHACIAAAGDVVLMRPLLVHASSASSIGTARRVIHIEFAAAELPLPAIWHDQIK